MGQPVLGNAEPFTLRHCAERSDPGRQRYRRTLDRHGPAGFMPFRVLAMTGENQRTKAESAALEMISSRHARYAASAALSASSGTTTSE